MKMFFFYLWTQKETDGMKEGERGGRDSGRQRGKQTRRPIDRWRAMICTDASKHTHTHTHTLADKV